VPEELLHRKKMGFGIPLGQWFRGELRELLSDSLLSTAARQRPFFDPAAISALIEGHQRGEEHGPRLWVLLMLELWCREVLDPARASTS
jgi:asparagine synthase (glutamine-hydrolysing)